MMRVYPSRHAMNLYPHTDGQPVERAPTLPGETVLQWAERYIPGFVFDRVQPITVDIDGLTILPADWGSTVIPVDADMRVYPQPQGIEIGAGFIAWVAAGIAAAALIYALTLSVDGGELSSNTSGDALEFSSAKANSVRLYEPVRVILGRERVYPDYVTQPVTRFRGPRDVRTQMLLCIANHPVDVLPSTLKIGTTPFSAFGSDVSYTIYEPGQFLGNDPRTENWFACPEVGSSKSATAGLDLDSPVNITAPIADSLLLQGNSVTLQGDAPSLPTNWAAGTIIRLEAPITYTLTEVGAYTMLSGDWSELGPVVGMPVTVAAPTSDLDLVVAVVSVGESTSVGFNYTDGTPVGGLGTGQQRLAVGLRDFRYRIASVDGVTLALQRINTAGNVDPTWGGFTTRTLVDFVINSQAASGQNWIGPFYICPEGETVDRFEYDVFFPGGLFHTDKKGNQIGYGSRVVVEYADVTGGPWVNITKTYGGNTRDGFGVTEVVNLAAPARVMVRMRRASYLNWANSQDNTQWFGLRGRLLERATSYAKATTVAIEVRTGERLSAQSDRKVNLVATHRYETGPSRKISDAVRYLCESIGARPGDVDLERLDELEQQFWTPRGETFDAAFTDQESALDRIRTILTAGMSHPIIEDAMVSAVREGVQPIMHMMTPQDTTSELRIGFKAPSNDDFGGVDVKYVDPVTFEVETVRCRLPGVNAGRVEQLELTGVQSRVRAWRIGMRRLEKHQNQRLTGQVSTEMDALAYQFLDHVLMTSDIPGDQTQSMIVEGVRNVGGLQLLELSEQPDWSFPNPRVIIRRQDGSVTQLIEPTQAGDKRLTLPAGSVDWPVNWDIDWPVLLFCSSESVGYSMLIDNIQPDGDGMCDVAAIEYSDDLYRWDNSTPDANGYPQELTA